MTYTTKTFDDHYGQHALVYADGSAFPTEKRVDVTHLLPKFTTWEHDYSRDIHPTRLDDDYKPKHEKPWLNIQRTTNDGYGRHALIRGMGSLNKGYDVYHLLARENWPNVHPLQMPADYQPKRVSA